VIKSKRAAKQLVAQQNEANLPSCFDTTHFQENLATFELREFLGLQGHYNFHILTQRNKQHLAWLESDR